MARILGGGLFGEMRGKLGSMVFARNRGGAYSRSYAKPVDPKTIAQLTARNNFGNASSNYHGLDASSKTLWQNFANMVFNPKTGTMGVPSGINAFIALHNVVNNAKLFDTFTVEVGGSPITFDPLFEFNQAGIPPVNSLQANFSATGGGLINFNFESASINSVTVTDTLTQLNVSFELNLLGGGIGTTGNIESFIDGGGNEFGFKIFMSNPVRQPGMFVNNPYQFDLGSGLGGTVDGTVPATGTMLITATNSMISGNYNAMPQEGDFVQLTVFQVGATGQLLRIGSSFTEYPAV